ncbi:MAG: DUF2807 domain-containing protein [Bacteroidia bacterium]|jgi:hypothetical protein|nr:DUF2807 domain-containing protein [Bacteroidia bacterium]
MNFKRKLTFAILLLAAASCKKAPLCDCFQGAGPQAADNRTPELIYFNQLDVKDNINVNLTIGPQEQVIIQGGQNLIKNISASVSNNVLTLKNENNCDWLRSYKKSIITVNITMPEVTNIDNEGVGTIQSTDTINTPNFKIQALSSGNVTLAVNCSSIYAFQFGACNLTLTGSCGNFQDNFYGGTGFLYADSLLTAYTFLSASTTGDCYVNTSGQLDVIINQIGNVYYSGNPYPIHITQNGSGQLYKYK